MNDSPQVQVRESRPRRIEIDWNAKIVAEGKMLEGKGTVATLPRMRSWAVGQIQSSSMLLGLDRNNHPLSRPCAAFEPSAFFRSVTIHTEGNNTTESLIAWARD